jgi:hypothetical protein
MKDPKRKIPYNYTSADDDQIIEHPLQRKRLFSEFKNDLQTIEDHAGDKAVLKVLETCKSALDSLLGQIKSVSSDQQRILRHLGPVIGKANIYFDPFNITAHATDATDWRRFSPVAILRPDKESQVPELVNKIKTLGFHIIPRGAGTGLTGGATPLAQTCVIINSEKLNKISDIVYQTDHQGITFASIELEAGVVPRMPRMQQRNRA